MGSNGNSTLRDILRRRCPKCRLGPLFTSSIFLFPRMHERCPVCALRFEREPGYFLGAMYISYGLGLLTIALLSLGVWAVTSWSLTRSIVWGMILFVPFAVPLTFFARVLWIYLDRAVDPERDDTASR